VRLSRGLSAVAIILGGCSYWQALPVGDTAPPSWNGPFGPTSRGALGSVAAPQERAATSSVEERLRNLEQLRRDGLIGEREYLERRKRVLAEEF